MPRWAPSTSSTTTTRESANERLRTRGPGTGCGFEGAGLGVAVLSGTGPHSEYVPIALGLALVGLASTVSFSALTSLLLASVSADQGGLASGVQNTTRQTGALMAVSIVGAVLNAHAMGSRLGVAFGVLAAAALVAVAMSSLALAGGAQADISSDRGPH